MTAGVPLRTTAVWVALVALTLASLWVGTGHVPGVRAGEWAAASVLGAAFVKAGLVGWHFMEIGGAATPLRVAFGGWLVVVCGTCTAFLVL